jgi:hypothetical protein
MFKDVQFYDYTKRYNRAYKLTNTPNYDLTLSFSGARETFANRVLKASKDTGLRVAVVFKDKILPASFKGLDVVNGDKTDLRFLDDKGVIVGLYAKGAAKKDTTGFVVSAV